MCAGAKLMQAYGRSRAARAAAATAVVFCGLTVALPSAGCDRNAGAPKNQVRIGAKNFTEQFILGELLAQLVEAKTDISVDRQFYLGGTMICHGALANGEIDVYPEYTGTALTTILKREVLATPEETYNAVAKAYREQFKSEWLSPLGFNNTYAITVREADAQAKNWQTVSDLERDASLLKAGFTAEFVERPDGYPGLKRKYAFEFGSVSELDAGLMYKALAAGEVDVICAFATDGRIAAYNLVPLEDDKRFFPPYFAAPVVRSAVLEAHPELRDVLNGLAGKLDDSQMQKLNYEVDEKKRSPADVAREFLQSQGLVD